jgi:translocation and assembly module TamB
MVENNPPKRSNIFRKILKWILGIAGLLILLVILVVLLLQIPAVQTYVTGRVVDSLSEQAGTHMAVDRVTIRLPSSVRVQGVYVEDLRGDTLLYAGDIRLGINLFGLLSNRLDVQSIHLSNIYANIERLYPDTVFNYQFLAEAFAGEGEPADDPPDQQNGMQISLGSISLENVRARFVDHMAGIDANVAFEEFSTFVSSFDQAEDLLMHFDQAVLINSRINLSITEGVQQPKAEESEPAGLDLMLNRLIVENLSFNMDSDDGSSLRLMVPDLEVRPERLDIENNLFHINAITGLDLSLQMINAASGQAETQEIAQDDDFEFRWHEIFDFDINLSRVYLSFAQLSVNTPGQQQTANEFDPGNLQLSNLVFDASNIVLNPATVSLDINNISASHPSGFRLRELSANIDLGPELRIDGFTLRTNQSNLQMNLFADLNPLDFSTDTLDLDKLDIDISEAFIAPDLGFFFPELRDYMEMLGQPGYLHFAGRIQGSLNNLSIPGFNLQIPGLVTGSLQGQVRGLPDIDNLVLDFPDFDIGISPARVIAMLPDTLQPQGMVMPDTVSLKGSFAGSFASFVTNIQLDSDIGNIDLQAQYDDDGLNPIYNATVNIWRFDPGILLDQQETLGPVTARISVTGMGLEPEIADMMFEVIVDTAYFNQYRYTCLEARGTLRNGILNSSILYEDENLSLTSVQDVLLTGEYPALILNLDLERANLFELNLSEDALLVNLQVNANMNVISEDFAVGFVEVNNLIITLDAETYSLSRLTIESSLSDDTYLVNLISPVLRVDYSANISPTLIPDVLGRHLDRYFSMPFVDNGRPVSGKNFEIKVTVPPSEWMSELLMPGLEFNRPLEFTSTFNSDQQLLTFDSQVIPEIMFNEMLLQGVQMNARTYPQEVTFAAGVTFFESGNLIIRNLLLEGQVADSIIDFNLSFNDQFRELWLNMPGTLKSYGDSWEFSLDTSLVINREPWHASPENFILFGAERLFVNDFMLESQGRHLLISSIGQLDEDVGAPPVNITFYQFDLGDFSILEDEPLFGGVFNGFITVQDIFNDLAFTADLNIDGFSMRGDTIGHIQILASNPDQDEFELLATVGGYGNEITIQGSYFTGDEAAVDVNVNLESVNLATLEGATGGEVTGLAGEISGRLRVLGPLENPAINGSLALNQVDFLLTQTGSAFTIPNEIIEFDRNTIRLRTFTIVDVQRGEAALDGTLNIADLQNISFSLDFTSNNFLLLDIPSGQNDLYYGRLLVDSDLRLRGDMLRPVVEGKLALNEGSRFTFVIPQTEPEAIGAQGVVVFRAPEDEFGYVVVEGAETTAGFQNLDLSVNIDVDPQTVLRIIIDEVAGDNLEVTGGGMLSFGIDPGGRMSMTGRYDITGGSYLLTFYDAIRRNFRIQSGSSIQWRGDPMDAIVDITAIYRVRTSARELLISYLEDGAVEGGALRQQFPFDVSLIMEGELQQPSISFAIALPEEHQDALQGRVQARLTELNQSESELNKQVFALLVLGNFIHENPFESIGGGPGLSATARSSASRILSQQLNRLSERYVRGVDVRFDIESYEDYATGEPEGRTELQMEVSRDFFDERLRITVGGNIEIEDETRRETRPAEIAGDFLLEYLLNQDGNLVLRAFRKRNYGDIFDGQVVETGVAMLFTRSYNVFREIFRRADRDAIFEPIEDLEHPMTPEAATQTQTDQQ